MLDRRSRVVKKEDYDRIFHLGKTFYQDMLSLKIAENGQKISRFGIVVGLKFSSLAVRRNRIKRQIREIVRKNIAEIKSGFDVVIMINKIAGKNEFSSEEIEKSFKNILKKAKLLK
ncbi:MAG TPA: ribonuclease P protein component [Patescibacteria group bacterium]|nr:ribonuclease P protein component [Patescibacteria group bacterium]